MQIAVARRLQDTSVKRQLEVGMIKISLRGLHVIPGKPYTEYEPSFLNHIQKSGQFTSTSWHVFQTKSVQSGW